MSLKLRADSDRRKLIEPLAAKYGLPDALVKDLLDDTLATILRMVLDTGRLQLRGFGVFRRKDIPELQRRNPRTGQPVAVPARTRVTFTEEGTHRRRLPPDRPIGSAQVRQSGLDVAATTSNCRPPTGDRWPARATASYPQEL